jgi:RNA polymerase sigma-70 factor, ECF subfamily
VRRSRMDVMAATLEPPWEELHANLHAFIRRRVRNQSDVDDLVQRVLLQIVKGLDSLRDAERLHAWVYRTARNVLIDYYRSPVVRREVPSGDAADLGEVGCLDAHAGPVEDDERAALEELAGCLTAMLSRLPPAHREAITLADLQGLNQAEAAARVGVSISGMKSRVQRGRKQLKAVLEACCRIQLGRGGGIVAYDRRQPDSCGPCSRCE